MQTYTQPDLFEWHDDEPSFDESEVTDLWTAIEDAGGLVVESIGPFVKVAIPHPAEPFIDAMEEAGLEFDEQSPVYSPLGNDYPPDRFRHFERYWLYGNFSPRP